MVYQMMRVFLLLYYKVCRVHKVYIPVVMSKLVNAIINMLLYNIMTVSMNTVVSTVPGKFSIFFY